MVHKIVILLSLCGLFLGGCSSIKPPSILQGPTSTQTAAILETEVLQNSPEPTPYLTKTPRTIPFFRPQSDSLPLMGINGFPNNINPLTGLQVADPSLLDRRPVMVKVSNYPRTGRPHAGLSYADWVFEYYIGEEANRFLALYYSQDCPKVGPVRSGRLVDAQLVSLYGGILGYGNADPKVDKVIVDQLGKRAFSFSMSPCPVMCGRDTHSVTGVFANTAEMSSYSLERKTDNTRPELKGIVFGPVPPGEQNFGIKLGVEYSPNDRGEWHYDPQTGLYQRWIEDYIDGKLVMVPLIDRLNNQQIAFANVIIIFAQYIEYAPTLHQIKIWDNTSGQRAVVFRDAMMIEAKWQVNEHNQPIQFYNKYGLPLALKPGNTWVVIAGMSSALEEPQPGQWEMNFALP